MNIEDKVNDLLNLVGDNRGYIILPGGLVFKYYDKYSYIGGHYELSDTDNSDICSIYDIVNFLLFCNLYDLLMLRIEEKQFINL